MRGEVLDAFEHLSVVVILRRYGSLFGNVRVIVDFVIFHKMLNKFLSVDQKVNVASLLKVRCACFNDKCIKGVLGYGSTESIHSKTNFCPPGQE